MLNKLLIIFISTTFILITTSVNAHDPALHKKSNAEKPNCQAIDHSKMDKNDPIMQAIMKQCTGEDSHGEKHRKENHGDTKKENKHKIDEHKYDHHG